MTFNLQFFGGSGAGSGRKKGGGGGSENKNEQETYIRGVPQSQIDRLRRTREHLGKNELTADIIKKDYARVGINISSEEAEQIHKAIVLYTTAGYIKMREALREERKGKKLTKEQKDILELYKQCIEYCKIAPTYKPLPFHENQTEIYRGLPVNKKYGEKIAELKPGDKWDVDKMPTSFSSEYEEAYYFAGGGFQKKGVVIHAPIKNLKNSPSIMGLSRTSSECEVLLGDYKWKVARKQQEINEENNIVIHIYLESDA